MSALATRPGVTSLVLHRLTGFAAELREAGIPVTAQEVIAAVEVLNALDLSESGSLYWGLRMAMVRDVEDLPVFDRAYREYWQGIEPPRDQISVPTDEESEDPDVPPSPGPSEGDGNERAGADREGAAVGMPPDVAAEPEVEGEGADRAAYSAVEVLRKKDFADYDEEDYGRLLELLAEVEFGGPWRISRRRRRHRRGRIDMRRTMMDGFRTGGEPMRRVHRSRTRKHRRLVFVCDVSGSMEAYSKAVLALAYVAARQRGDVEAFAFATRLTRLTPELTGGDPAAALRGATAKVVDWSGGTRVGACLRTLNRTHPAALRAAVIVIASDGWDLGEPGELRAEADLLQRSAHRLIWVNPHLQDPEFEPLTRGMSAALPFVDEFLSCHNFESFARLVELVEDA